MLQIQTAFYNIFNTLSIPQELGLLTLSNRPELSELQCNGALGAAKLLKQSPLKIANSIVNLIPEDLKSLIDVTIDGPGFINIKLKDHYLISLAEHNLTVHKVSQKVLIDYGSPNVAKGMHVGHLRSTLIGAALVNLHKFAGHEVIGDNHLGDWGTPLGIVITKIAKQLNFDWSLESIESLYVEGSKEFKTDETFKQEVLNTTRLLQNNDPKTKALWQKVVDTTITSLKQDYSKLGVEFDLWEGESSFELVIPMMLQELAAKGLVQESNGAKVVEVNNAPPLILEKTGGGFLYHTTDLACLKTRFEKYDQILYVVDKRQNLHFQQVFAVAKEIGYLKDNQAYHIAFGTINGADGKPYKTRSGEVLKLKDLITQFEEEASVSLQDLTSSEQHNSVSALAMGALKFAELKHNRMSDYEFDLKKFMRTEGFTGPYVMYAAVRAKSILNKLNTPSKKSSQIYSPTERDLLVGLNQFTMVFNSALKNNEPHQLCEYVFSLANLFNRFYNENPISIEKDLTKKQHLLWIVEKTHKTITQTLTLLGISVPEKM